MQQTIKQDSVLVYLKKHGVYVKKGILPHVLNYVLKTHCRVYSDTCSAMVWRGFRGALPHAQVTASACRRICALQRLRLLMPCALRVSALHPSPYAEIVVKFILIGYIATRKINDVSRQRRDLAQFCTTM
ncbi:MAG: hypothetical protein ACOH2B_08100 [Burkholderiaceae bacterium]